MGDLVSLFAYMDAQIGVGETPPHSNHVVLRDGTDLWRDIYGYQPPPAQAAWCALFQSTCDLKNGTPLPAMDFRYGYVGVDAGRAWFKRNGLLVPDPRPGYLVFYDEHTGRVRRLNPDGTFWSLEGNEGDAVRLILRHRSEVVGGFGVREYESAANTVTPEEEDMPTAYAAPGGQAILPITPGRKGAVVIVSDQHPTNGANVRIAVGSDRAGGDGKPNWVGGNAWIPPHRVGVPIPPGAEVVNVENSGPNGVGVSVEYAA